jgi:hypothetical protein
VRQEKEEEVVVVGSRPVVVLEVDMRLPIIHRHGVVSHGGRFAQDAEVGGYWPRRDWTARLTCCEHIAEVAEGREA